MVNSHRLSLAMHRVANGFSPILVGGQKMYKSLYHIEHKMTKLANNAQSISEYFVNKFKGTPYAIQFKNEIEKQFDLSNPINYIVAAYSLKHEYTIPPFRKFISHTIHFTAIKIIPDENGENIIDENSVFLDAGDKYPAGLWGSIYSIKYKGKCRSLSNILVARNQIKHTLIKQDFSRLYAPFYYNLIDTLPKGMHDVLQKIMVPAIEKF